MNNNPLKQYFRRPAMYLRLPSGGKLYDSSVIVMPENGELPVYPMTAIDEVTSKTPDALYNGIAVAELVASCIPCIKKPWALSSVDVDAILIAIRAASVGSEMEIDSVCPSCDELNKFDLSLMPLLGSIKMADYDTPITIGALDFKIKPLTMKELNSSNIAQFEIQRGVIAAQNMENDDERNAAMGRVISRMNALAMDVVSDSIEYIKTPDTMVDSPEFIAEYLSNCDKKVYEKIRDTAVAMRQQSDIKPLNITCAHCQHEYQQPFTLNVSDFFE